MEENNVKVKKSIKIKLIALITVLLICAAAVVGVLVAPKEEEVVKTPEENLEETLEKEQKASDEATLRELLAKEEELVIEVTEDIIIDKMISIKGTKTLTGSGTISMELYVAPYQYMFTLEKGGNLTLDGVTVDGNGSSNCFKVEKTAELTLLSGELTWGCPTIIESFGDVYIKGGSITNAVGTGVYVHSGGNAYMTAGTVRDCVDCGIETAVDSYLSVSEKAMLQNNMEYFIYSRGTCDITGGTFRNAQSDMVYTSGVMNVKGTADEMLEWHDIKGCGIIVGNGGELNVDRLHIHDVENRAISMAAGESVANVSNCLFENTGGDGVYIRTEMNLTNVEIRNAGLSGIMLIQTGKATIDNVTVTDTVKDGIQNGGGVVTGKNFVVNNAGRIGVNCYKLNDVSGTVDLKNVTVNGTVNSNGLHVETSKMTVSNVKIYNTGNEGARIQKGGSLNLTNVEVHNAKGRSITAYDEGSVLTLKNVKTFGGQRGIGAFGGDVKATNVSIDSPTEYGVTGSKKSVVEITDLTIKNSGGTGVNANDAKITITNAAIEDTKKTAAVNADYSGTITLKNADIKFAEGITENIDGVKAVSPATVTLENVNMVNVPWRSVYANGADAKITLSDVTTTGGKRGIQIFKGGQVEGKNIAITSPSEYGISCGDEGSGFKLTDLTVTECGKHGVNVYDGAVATVTNGTITKPANLGAFVGNKGQLTLNNVTITESAATGLMNDSATLNVKGGSVTLAGAHGVYTYKGGHTNLMDFEVVNSANHNIRVDNENSNNILTNVKTTGGKRGVQIYSGGKVAGKTVTITSPTEYGIACGEKGSSFDITDLTVNRKGDTGVSSGSHAVNVYDGAIATVTTGKLIYPGGNGVNVDKDAELTLNNVDVEYAGAHGVYVQKAKVKLTGTMKIESPAERGIINVGGTVDAKEATVDVDNPGAYGVATNVFVEETEAGNVETPGTTTIGKLEIASAGEEKVSYSSMTVNGAGTVVTVLEGKIEDSWKHGINVENGTLNLSNFKITNSGQQKGDKEIYDGVQAQKNSTVNLTNVEITGGTNGIKVQDGGKVVDSKNVKIISPATYGIEACREGSSFVITGLTIEKSGSHTFNIWDKAAGTVNGLTEGEETTKSTITNPGGHGANLDKSATLTLSNVDIIFAEEKTGNFDGVHFSRSANVNLHNVKVTDAPRHGVHVDDGVNDSAAYGTNGKLTLTGTLDVVSPTKRGLANYGGTVDGSSATVTITNPGEFGVAVNGGKTSTIGTLNISGAKGYSSMTVNGTGTVVTVNGGKIENSKQHGLNVNAGTLNLSNFVVQGFAQYGVEAQTNSTIKLTDVQIIGGERGIRIQDAGKVIESKDVTITSSSVHAIECCREGSNFNISGLTVQNSGNHALNVWDKGTGTVTGITEGEETTKSTITNPGGHGANLDKGSTLTLNDVDINFAEEKTGAFDGVHCSRSANVNLHNVKVTDAPRHGVHVDDGVDDSAAYGTNGKLTLTGTLDVVSPKARGLANYGGSIDGNTATVTITNPQQFGVAVNGGKTSTIGTLNITGAGQKGDSYSSMTVNGTGTVVTVNGGKIENSWRHGLNVEYGTLNLSNFTIKDSGKKNDGSEYDGVNAQKQSTVNLTNVTIIGGGKGINAVEGANVTITGGNISGVTGTNLYVTSKADDTSKSNATINGTLTMTGAKRGLAIYNGSSVTKGENGGNITITSPSEHGVRLYNSGSSLNIDTLNVTGGGVGVEVADKAQATIAGGTISNTTGHGVYVKTQAQATIAGGTISNTAGHGVYIEGSNNATSTPQSKATLSGTTISNAGTTADQRGIFLEKYGEAELTNVNINNTKKGDNLYLLSNSKATINGTLTTQGGRHSLAIYGGSSVTKGENGGTITINSPTSDGIRTYNSGSSLNITVLNVNNCGAHGLEIGENAQVTIEDVNVMEPGKNGVYVLTSGVMNLTKTANVQGAGERSFRIDTGTLSASNATINITSSTQYALSTSGTTTATIGTLTVTGAGGFAAVNATDTSAITINGGTITGATGHGVNAAKSSTLNLTNIVISGSANNDINVEANTATVNLTGMVEGTHYTKTGGFTGKINK
ncbi:MAG: right-handed parallel beta-helix repeat-containing protein [Tyzzerella sp.]|nr:right-handed parallel beta-helix repeat-containing protein [Tyzzerella sp.]